MRPPTDLVLRLSGLQADSAPLLLTLRRPRPTEDLTTTQVRAALVRAGIPFAETKMDANHRVYWALFPARWLDSDDPKLLKQREYWAKRSALINPDEPMGTNLRFVYDTNPDGVSRQVLERYPEPTPDKTLRHAPLKALESALTLLRQGGGLRFFPKPGDHAPSAPGFIRREPLHTQGAVDYWRDTPRTAVQEQNADSNVAFELAAGVMGDGDYLMLPSFATRADARRLTRALQAAGKPAAVTRQMPQGYCVWATCGKPLPGLPPSGFPVGSFAGEPLYVRRGLEPPKIEGRGRRKGSTFPVPEIGVPVYVGDKNQAQARNMSLRRQGFNSRFGCNEVGLWYVIRMEDQHEP